MGQRTEAYEWRWGPELTFHGAWKGSRKMKHIPIRNIQKSLDRHYGEDVCWTVLGDSAMVFEKQETYGLLHFICTKVSVKTQSQLCIIILILPVLLSELF